jgi:DNA-binding response OmpR family regulator
MVMVLYVEDDLELARRVARAFRREGWTVDLAHDGRSGLRYAENHTYDVALLDWILPDAIDGLQICHYLRRNAPQTRVILCSILSDDAQVIDALGAGVDEYVAKPCEAAVLVARIQAHLRRSEPPARPTRGTDSVTGLTYGPFQLDLVLQTVTANGKLVEVTRQQFQMLAHMIANAGRAIPVEEFRARLLRTAHDTESSNIRWQIKQLRNALEGFGDIIETDRGVGYGIGLKITAARAGG